MVGIFVWRAVVGTGELASLGVLAKYPVSLRTKITSVVSLHVVQVSFEVCTVSAGLVLRISGQ